MTVTYHLGLDLGQAADYTALCIVERGAPEVDAAGKTLDPPLNVRHLQRFKLGTSYPDIVAEVVAINSRLTGGPHLVFDATGVGRPVVDLFKKAGLSPYAVTLTAGNTPSNTGMDWTLPKRDLITRLNVALQEKRLHVSRALPEAPTLLHELNNYKVKISLAGHDSYNAWRESDHDDLVIATGLAVWSADKFGSGGRFHVVTGTRRW